MVLKEKMPKKTLFGLNFDTNTSEIVILPVPWDATTSYTDGTHSGPEHILDASHQLDLYHPHFPLLPEYGVSMAPISSRIKNKNLEVRKKATQLIKKHEANKVYSESDLEKLKIINNECQDLHIDVYNNCLSLIKKNALIGVLGGEHSVSLGAIKALSETVGPFGILQIDAHMDLRESYQGFEYSHASIMHHAIQIKNMRRLVQVGIRDYAEEELLAAKESKGKVKTFTTLDINHHLFEGKSWHAYCKKIVNALPDDVYVSFDIDGLTAMNCPNTGTPVPGGLTFDQAMYLLYNVVKSGRRMIGFDLVEVAPGKESEWNGNVGARVLFHLCGYMHASHNR